MKSIDKKFVRYIPKKLQPYLVWLEQADCISDNSHVYWITFQIDGEEKSLEPCDTIAEVKQRCRELMNELRKNGQIK